MKPAIHLLLAVMLLMPFSKAAGQAGKTLLEEHFVENERGWNLGDDKDVVRRIEDGKLILECKKYLTTKGGYWIKVPDFKLPATNYSVAITTHWIKNMKTDETYSPYGVILGDYFFLLYGDGNRRLLRLDPTDNKYVTIVDWGENAAIKKKGAGDNRIEIQYRDGKVGFYSNGELIYKKEATIPDATPIKLYVENSEVVSFDDLVVKAL